MLGVDLWFLLRTFKKIVECVVAIHLLEAKTTERNVETLLKECVYGRIAWEILEKLQFLDKRTKCRI